MTFRQYIDSLRPTHPGRAVIKFSQDQDNDAISWAAIYWGDDVVTSVSYFGGDHENAKALLMALAKEYRIPMEDVLCGRKLETQS